MTGRGRQSIALALAGGDEGEFASLLDAYFGRMLRFARLVEPDKSAATRAVRRAWEAALRQPEPPEAFPTLDAWLFALTHEGLRASHAGPQPAAGTDLDPSAFEEEGSRWAGHWRDDGAPDPWGEREADAWHPALVAGLRDLPPVLRALVVLHDVEGLDALEITAALGMTRDTQVAYLHRARTTLRRALAEGIAAPVASS